MNHNRSLHAIAFVFVFFCSVFQVLALDGNQDTTLPKAKNGLYVVAHRGAHINIPENSLPAYQKAIDLGCDFVEIDVRSTKDGRFVSMHNSEIDEYVRGSSGKVSEMTFSEVKALDIGIKISPEWKDTRVPSFEEILQLCRGKIGIYLDLKSAPVPELIGIIKQYKMERDILWYIPSSRFKEISELASNCPECILMPDPGKEDSVIKVIEKLDAKVLATDMGELSNSFVYKAHSLNAAVIVDEDKGTEAEWTKIIEWHTDGIQTDNPEKLISFLKSRKNPLDDK
jgi:glycerophosphoryl diester phosphodiesterase